LEGDQEISSKSPRSSAAGQQFDLAAFCRRAQSFQALRRAFVLSDRCHLEDSMWREILDKFRRYPAQERVIRLILQRGFQVNEQGRVVSGGIEIAHAQIAKELNVDRRVVDTTALAIREDEELWKIFKNVRSLTFLGEVAPVLGLGVIEITPVDAAKTGLLGSVASTVAHYGLSIRQAVSDDPYFVENPKLTIITEGKAPGELVRKLMEMDGVKRVTVY
jgi:predicted regulator of amino acid metabolism with ACT domain